MRRVTWKDGKPSDRSELLSQTLGISLWSQFFRNAGGKKNPKKQRRENSERNLKVGARQPETRYGVLAISCLESGIQWAGLDACGVFLGAGLSHATKQTPAGYDLGTPLNSCASHY